MADPASSPTTLGDTEATACGTSSAAEPVLSERVKRSPSSAQPSPLDPIALKALSIQSAKRPREASTTTTSQSECATRKATRVSERGGVVVRGKRALKAVAEESEGGKEPPPDDDAAAAGSDEDEGEEEDEEDEEEDDDTISHTSHASAAFPHSPVDEPLPDEASVDGLSLPRLKSILVTHGVRFNASASKKKLAQQVHELLAARRKATTDRILDGKAEWARGPDGKYYLIDAPNEPFRSWCNLCGQSRTEGDEVRAREELARACAHWGHTRVRTCALAATRCSHPMPSL